MAHFFKTKLEIRNSLEVLRLELHAFTELSKEEKEKRARNYY